MPRRKPLQTNFSAGELAPELGMRQDTEQYANGARSLLNRRCLIGGGTRRRPGTWYEAELSGLSRCRDFIVDAETQYVLVFSSGRMDAYVVDIETGELTAAGSLTSTAWTANIWDEMGYEQSGNTVFLTHTAMPTQRVVRTGVSSWSVSAFSFFTNGPRTEQPYAKVADPAVTLQPSALTGSITLTTSVAHFTASHVNQIIRYVERECRITAVGGGGTTATATVLESLPITTSITFASSAGYTVGESVQGQTTGAAGIITAIPDGTHIEVLSTNQIGFSAAEPIVGPQQKTTSSGTAPATPAATTEWDEQIIGPVYGYPACCVLHRNRLLFGGHPEIPNAVMGSRIDNLYSFDVGDASDADGFFETVGDAGASSIVQMFSAEQLLVLTDRGPYYVPESEASPFRPTSIAFFPFGSGWPITPTARARAFDDGVVFLSRSLVIKARPTGDVRHAWAADEVSILSSHLVSNPARLTTVSNYDDGPERYAIMVNDDGTLAVLQLVELQKIRNMTPWVTEGLFTSVSGLGRFLYATTQRTVGGSTRYFLERFDQDVTLDLVQEFADEAALNSDVTPFYGSTPVNVVTADLAYHLGEYPPEIETLPDGPFHVGLFYDSEIEILPPLIEDREGNRTGELMRICEAIVVVRGSARFAANGRTLAAYQVTDDLDDPPPEKNGSHRFTFLGWEIDPTVTISQPDPLKLEVLAVKTIVAF